MVDACLQPEAAAADPHDGSPCSSPTAGYDYDEYRDQLRRRGITRLIARRRVGDHNTAAGRVVEQTLAPLHQLRRLATRWERRLDIHQGVPALGCVSIC